MCVAWFPGFLRIQYSTIAIIAIPTAFGIGMIYILRGELPGDVNPYWMAFSTALSFLLGAFCSAFAGCVIRSCSHCKGDTWCIAAHDIVKYRTCVEFEHGVIVAAFGIGMIYILCGELPGHVSLYWMALATVLSFLPGVFCSAFAGCVSQCCSYE